MQYNLKTLKAEIPTHCFNSSLLISLPYLLRDLTYAGLLIYATTYIPYIPTTLRFCAWLVYGFLQGCVGTGLWILAHECGHGAFSKHQNINDTIGWAIHSLLLVPYFSWKITRARHHRYTGHLTKDTAFVPISETQFKDKHKINHTNQIPELLEETPFVTLMYLIGHQLVAWQMYLISYASSGKQSGFDEDRPLESRIISHYDPTSEIFSSTQRVYIILSDFGLLATGCMLTYAGMQVGLVNIVLLYFVPYVWVHHWIVAITYLHHNHPSVPHFAPEAWSFTKGALCTVDRSFGFIGQHFFHEIIDYHVVHHLFPKIPFYYAQEATEAIQPLLVGHYHQSKQEGFLSSLFDTFSSCWYVSENSRMNPKKPGVYWWVTGKADLG